MALTKTTRIQSTLSLTLTIAVAYGCTQYSIADELTTEELLVTSKAISLEQLELSAALSSFDASLLAQANISHSSELVKLAPSLTTLQSFSNRQSAFLIRGLGTLIFSAGIEPSVITTIDGVSQGSAAQSMLPVLDMRRVEIWRGPQVTRFGRHAAAGVINLVSERASEQWQGRLQLNASTVDEFDSNAFEGSAYFGGPISENLGVRFGLVSKDTEGFINNVFGNQDLNGGRQTSLISKFDWAASESLSVALDLNHSKARADCCAPIVTTVNSAQISNTLQPIIANTKNRASNTNTAFIANSRTSSARLALDKTFASGASIQSITAASKYAERESQDFDFLPIDLIPISAGYDTHNQFSQQVRFESAEHAVFNYALGAYYEQQDRDREYDRAFLSIARASFQADISQRSLALFAHGAFDISDHLSVESGLRHSDERIEFRANRDAFPLQGLAALNNVADSDDGTALDMEATLHYRPDTRYSMYLRWARAHKAPAYNVIFDLDADALQSVRKERGESWELSYKHVFPDRQLMLGATAFHTQYDDYQAQIQEPGSTKLQLINSGDILSYGLELEADWANRHWRVRTAVDWTTARIGKVQGVLCGNGEVQRGECPAGYRNLKGEALPFAPDVKLNVIASYTFNAKPAGFELTLDSLYRWQSSMQTAFNNDPMREEGAFGVWSLGFTFAGQSTRVRIYADNIFDKNFALAHFDNPVDAGGYLSFYARESARQLGISLTASF